MPCRLYYYCNEVLTIGIGRCWRLGGPEKWSIVCVWKFLTMPTFCSNHRRPFLQQHGVCDRQARGSIDCRMSSKSSRAYFEAIYSWRFMWWLMDRPMPILICVLTGCILVYLATSQSDGWESHGPPAPPPNHWHIPRSYTLNVGR